MPKVGKTDMLAQLPSCMIADADKDEGAALYECISKKITCTEDADELVSDIVAWASHKVENGMAMTDPGIFPYRFLAADPLDRFELFAEQSATEKYRRGPLNSGKKFETKGFTSIRELEDGGGYMYLWNETTRILDNFSAACPNFIATAHVREKFMGGKTEKTGDQVTVQDIDLTGKLSSIICASVDAIGYVYRNPSREHLGELWISFETNNSAVMGARQKFLAGQKMPFTWDRIYPDIIKRDEATGLYSLIGKEVAA